MGGSIRLEWVAALNRNTHRRNKLDWQPGIANPNGSKPKGMHWNTFHCLTAKHDDFANQAMLAISAKLEILTNRVSGL